MFSINDPDHASHSAEGLLSPMGQALYGMTKKFARSPMPTFMRMVVIDVIPDPTQITIEKASYYSNILGVTNWKYTNLLPRNSIVAQRINDSRSSIDSPIFLFPFFPSHLALPCKPGEIVWAMFEDPNAFDNNLGFWFCRISEPHITDDVNHTHAPLKSDGRNEKSLIQVAGATPYVPKYEMHNGPVATVAEISEGVPVNARMVSIEAEGLSGDDVFEKLITTTDGSRLIQYEAVPRFKKRPGDIALEGTNNTLIVLGTERTGSIGEYQLVPNFEKYGPAAVYSEKVKGSFIGSIDIVAGRGTLPTTGGNVVDTTSISSPSDKEDTKKVLKKEIAKYPPEKVVKNEGDLDFENDRSRILVSQRTVVDTNFKTAGYNQQFQINDSLDGDAAITIKTDKVRIIARSDISLIVTNFKYNPTSIDNSTPGFKTDNTDQQKWASITIKTNGDIVFTPSKEGYIKLGGDSADKAVVCTDLPFTPDPQNPGQVAAAPIFTTGNSQVATSEAGQGTYAKKVLVIG